MKGNTLIVLTLFLSCLINAQRSTRLITMENSKLPENDILSVAVDHSGNKWFGTANEGLVKYNGETFVNFNAKNSIIKGKYIGPLFVDSKVTLWISTSNPDGLFAIRHDSIVEIKNEIVEGLGHIIAIAKNSNGDLYFGGNNGLIKYDGKKWLKVKLPVKKIVVRAIDINSNNTIAIGYNEGLLIGTESKWKILEEENGKLQLAVVRGLKFTSNNKLIIGYGGGMGKGGFSVMNGTQWTHYNKSNSNISDNMVRDIEVDKKGSYWMASNNGVIKFYIDGKTESILFREGMYLNTIMDIAIENNTIWIATNFGVIELDNVPN